VDRALRSHELILKELHDLIEQSSRDWLEHQCLTSLLTFAHRAFVEDKAYAIEKETIACVRDRLGLPGGEGWRSILIRLTSIGRNDPLSILERDVDELLNRVTSVVPNR